MKLTPVKSSNVVAVGYDAANQVLTVQYKTGAYEYIGVPPEKWEALQNVNMYGKSVGGYISANIVRNHKHRKVEVPS